MPNQTIEVLGKKYEVLDTKEQITIADSFVAPLNKIGGGHGEGVLYVGNDNEENRSFFGNKGFRVKCFLLKNDLLAFLEDTKEEYENPEQPYRDKTKLKNSLPVKFKKIKELKNGILLFDLKEQVQRNPPRIYTKSESLNYKLIRELSLPNISYLSIIKLRDSQSGEIVYYFKLFADFFGEDSHPALANKEEAIVKKTSTINNQEKEQIVKARKGQGKYRKDLLEECPFCPITMVADDRLLIASHIKPWKDSDNKEKIDPKNGFSLTPTFDRLFDQGLMSFTDDKKMMVSPWLSKMTCLKLGIASNKTYPHLPVTGREIFLEYHRKNIFKGISS